jgi:hypothetical protein
MWHLNGSSVGHWHPASVRRRTTTAGIGLQGAIESIELQYHIRETSQTAGDRHGTGKEIKSSWLDLAPQIADLKYMFYTIRAAARLGKR